MRQKRGYVDVGCKHWVASERGRFDPIVASFADRHYSRRTPGSPQFMPPGEIVVLVEREGRAVFCWNRQRFTLNNRETWVCTIFRNESPILSSELILDAELSGQLVELGSMKWTRALYPCKDGFSTYIDTRYVQSKNPGYCFLKAGWQKSGWSADGHKLLLTKPWELRGRLPGEQGDEQRSRSEQANVAEVKDGAKRA